MSSTVASALSLIITIATQIAVTEWLTRTVLELPSKRPWGAAVATVMLTALAVGTTMVGFDAIFGVSTSSVSRAVLVAAVHLVQTGLVVRLVYRTSLPLSFGNGVVLALTWVATSFLCTFCARLGALYGGIPLLLLLTAYAVKLWQDHSLTRLMDSVPPTAPNAPIAQG